MEILQAVAGDVDGLCRPPARMSQLFRKKAISMITGPMDTMLCLMRRDRGILRYGGGHVDADVPFLQKIAMRPFVTQKFNKHRYNTVQLSACNISDL